MGAGNDYLLLLLHIILGMDWKIAMDNPTYLSAYLDFEKMGYSVVTLEPDGMGMCPDQLEESKATLAYVMPSHHFPLGTVMPIKRRQELLAWAAAKENRFLIEDDYDSEFRYKGKPIPSLQGFDSHDKVFSGNLFPVAGSGNPRQLYGFAGTDGVLVRNARKKFFCHPSPGWIRRYWRFFCGTGILNVI